jgi:hypothetical protein
VYPSNTTWIAWSNQGTDLKMVSIIVYSWNGIGYMYANAAKYKSLQSAPYSASSVTAAWNAPTSTFTLALSTTTCCYGVGNVTVTLLGACSPPPSPPPPSPPPSPPPPSPPPPPPPLAKMQAAPTYAGQMCFSTIQDCNLYSPCAYLSPRAYCNASLASRYSTCTSGPANLNSSNLAFLDFLTNASGTFTSTTDDKVVDGVDQFLCDVPNIQYNALPGASGMLCYPTATACAADPLNPCSATTPCGQDLCVPALWILQRASVLTQAP